MINISIAKPDYGVVVVVQPLRARCVVFNLFCVRIAINLDDQPTSSTIKVHDEPVNWMLPAKLPTVKLRISQTRPELAFGRRLRVAQLTRAFKYRRINTLLLSGRHLCVPSVAPLPDPLPVGERERALPSPWKGEGFGMRVKSACHSEPHVVRRGISTRQQDSSRPFGPLGMTDKSGKCLSVTTS